MNLLAAGVYDLGLTAADFSSFTPRHIDAFYKRHLAAETRRMTLTLWYANVNRDRDRHPQPFVIDDFVPGATHAARYQVIDSLDDFEGLTPEEKMQRMIGKQPPPELIIQRIKNNLQGHQFGKWTVDNG